MTRDQMISVVKQEVKGLRSRFEEQDWSNAVNDALRDTGWPFPITDDTKILWTKNRMKRHLFYMLWSESAHKFKFKQYNLQHRFDHYGKLIAKMDEEWNMFLEGELLLVDGGVGAFGTKVDAGFQYDETGHETTYTEDNLVLFNPTQSD
ncbi:MAG: hypothetical protein ACWGQW_02435 [bacterium]